MAFIHLCITLYNKHLTVCICLCYHVFSQQWLHYKIIITKGLSYDQNTGSLHQISNKVSLLCWRTISGAIMKITSNIPVIFKLNGIKVSTNIPFTIKGKK